VRGNTRVGGNTRGSGDVYTTPKEEILPEILSSLPKEVTAITIDGKNYKLETKWVLEE
jgi:hypothetical protein